MTRSDELTQAVERELADAAPDRLAQMAAALAAATPGAGAVVHYGSTLRSGRLEGELVDFYLIVDGYRAAFGSRVLALANRWLPPNVFPFAWEGLRAKVAVLDWAALDRLVRPDAAAVSVWARFAQPLRLAWARDEEALGRVAAAAAQAVLTTIRTAAPMADDPTDPLDVWRTALALTYGAELRAERGGRVDEVIDAAADRYRSLGLMAARSLGWSTSDGRIGRRWRAAEQTGEARRWRRRRLTGKALTLARLAKASATYGGGIDYLADKIERHSGVPVPLKPWQRRVPILGALWLLPALVRAGAVR